MAQPRREHRSPWSLRIATVVGIPIRLHVTFLLLLVWIGTLALREESRIFAALIPAVFVCVVLHEFGHALVARAFGIGTRDVTLYPIGGVAMLESRAKPAQELWIALAGPAVNVVIALALLPAVYAIEGRMPELAKAGTGANFVQELFWVNVFLPVFNMIPALPMDGGRVLRALLGLKLPELRATQIAGAIGQAVALGMGFFGLLTGHLLLLVIALFVFVGAGHEVQASVGLSLVSGKSVAEAMLTNFRTLDSGASLNQAAEALLEGSQPAFPIVLGEQVLGVLTREGIVRGLASEGPQGYVAGQMDREYRRFSPDDPLDKVLEALSQTAGAPALVFDSEERLVGMITSENLAEFLMVRQALRRSDAD